jgi:hypothetical protein
MLCGACLGNEDEDVDEDNEVDEDSCDENAYDVTIFCSQLSDSFLFVIYVLS